MYRLTDSDSIIRIADGATIGADPANTDYAAFLRWCADGNEPLPYAPPPFNLEPALERLRAMRRPIIADLVGMLAVGDIAPDDVPAVKTAIQQLKDITKHPSLKAATSDEDFDAKAKALYSSYAAALPASVRVAYRDATR